MAENKQTLNKTSKTKKTDEIKIPSYKISKKDDVNLQDKEEIFEIDYTKDFNESQIFNVNLYRDIFMELRKQLDDLSARRGKSEKSYAEYDNAVYNITATSVTDPSAQDFMGYCYKKGFYDFCLMNYEKYMKWTILAASNGNAFSLSKLQIYLTTAIEKLLSIPNISDLQDFMELKNENFVIFLCKLLCEQIVKIMDISAEKLIKMPEKYLEQTEENQKEFDKAKLEASKIVSEKIENVLFQLNKQVELMIEQETSQSESENEEKDEKPVPENNEESTKLVKESESENKFKRNLDIKKKFRY